MNTGWVQAWYPMESVTRARTYPTSPFSTYTAGFSTEVASTRPSVPMKVVV